MKFMKLGVHPDTFYTEEATRTVISDVPSDLIIRINNITYLLHKCSLLPKCGLLHRLLSENKNSGDESIDLHDIPGGEEAFELCAKFCYGITINLSAHNFVSAFCAAKFLKMSEAVENGNLITKLETFFTSCILEGWKDSVVTLRSSERMFEWSENLGIVRRCIESIVEKMLTPPAKVTWSYTYTRPGYKRKRHPKDWWTEDISSLGIDMFRSVLTTAIAANMLQPRLIGEALHVYACSWLLEGSENRGNGGTSSPRRVLEIIVSLIPPDKGSVSVKFLLRLLSLGNSLGVSHVAKAQLLRLSAWQLEDATLNDLLFPSNHHQTSYDIDLVKTAVQSFLRHWKKQQSVRSIQKVGKLIDSYLQVVAKDRNMTVQKMASLIETLPGIARPLHDDLYKAINTYLKEHPDMSKEDKKHLCRYLDCQKLSPEIRSHAVKNDRLPLRTVVQALFFDQEKSSSSITNKNYDELSSKLKLIAEEQSSNTHSGPGPSRAQHHTPELSFKVNTQMETAQKKGQVKRVSVKTNRER